MVWEINVGFIIARPFSGYIPASGNLCGKGCKIMLFGGFLFFLIGQLVVNIVFGWCPVAVKLISDCRIEHTWKIDRSPIVGYNLHLITSS